MRVGRILTFLGCRIVPSKRTQKTGRQMIDCPYKCFWINPHMGDSWVKGWTQFYGMVAIYFPKESYFWILLPTINEAAHILNWLHWISTRASVCSIIGFQSQAHWAQIVDCSPEEPAKAQLPNWVLIPRHWEWELSELDQALVRKHEITDFV